MSERRMDTDLRERAVLPVLVPVAAIVVTEIVVFSMSRVLLASSKDLAVGIALVAAIGILVVAAVIARRPRIRTSTIVGLLVVLGLGTVVAGGVAAQRGAFYEREGAGGEAEAVSVSAANVAFDTTTIELGGGKATVHFRNADVVAHNIAIFPDEQTLDKALFRGEIIQGGEDTTYDIELEPGTYYFHCDVHPNMSGSVVVQ